MVERATDVRIFLANSEEIIRRYNEEGARLVDIRRAFGIGNILSEMLKRFNKTKAFKVMCEGNIFICEDFVPCGDGTTLCDGNCPMGNGCHAVTVATETAIKKWPRV